MSGLGTRWQSHPPGKWGSSEDAAVGGWESECSSDGLSLVIGQQVQPPPVLPYPPLRLPWEPLLP